MVLVHVAAPVQPVILIVLAIVGSAVKMAFNCAADRVLYCKSIVGFVPFNVLLACMVIVASLFNFPSEPFAVNTVILAAGKLIAVNCSQIENAIRNVTDAASLEKVVAVIV